MGRAWFEQRSRRAVRDFWEAYDRLGHEAWLGRLLAHARDAVDVAAEQIALSRELLREAQHGDFSGFERYLERLGNGFAERGIALTACLEISNAFYAEIARRMVDDLSTDPARLAEALACVGEYLERALMIITRQYDRHNERLQLGVETRHRRVIDASPDPVIAIDKRGVVIAFNPAAERTFGYAADDAIGRPLAQLVIPARFRDQHARGLAQVVATQQSHVIGRRVEMVAMRADGSELPVELAIIATTGDDGEPEFVGFLRDLGPRRLAEETSALWAHALDQAAFGLVVSEQASRIIRQVNASYARMLGYDVEALIGMPGDHLLTPETREALPTLAASLRDTRLGTYELRLQRADRTTIPVLVSSSPVTTSPGTQLLVSTVIDISEREHHEKERATAAAKLEASAVRLATVSNAAHEFASVSGDVGALLELVARRLAEVIGDGCSVRLISDDGQWLDASASYYHRDPTTLEPVRRVLASERQRVGDGATGRVAKTGEALLIPELDSTRVMDITAAPFRELMRTIHVTSLVAVPLRSRGRTIGVVGLMRNRDGHPYTLDDQRLAQDLSDRAGLAIDNATLVATLERRVRERTAELESANRELEAFSYSVTHDLRTPLRAIDGFSRALADDCGEKLDEQSQHYLQRIRAATQRMDRIIDDLLQLARLGRATVKSEQVDVSRIATQIVDEMRRREPDRHVLVDIAPGLSTRGDVRLVTILLENLIGNAWKFTARKADARITVGETDGALFVRDNGAGFDMAYADKLFMPFQRLHADHEFSGEGIGLATVHRIVALHRGRIWAESTPNEGATFLLTLEAPDQP